MKRAIITRKSPLVAAGLVALISACLGLNIIIEAKPKVIERSFPPLGDEYFSKFQVNIEVDVTGKLIFTELIDFHSAGKRIRRGVCRQYPTQIVLSDGRTQPVDVKLEMVLINRSTIFGPDVNAMEPIVHEEDKVRFCLAVRDKQIPPGDHSLLVRYSVSGAIEHAVKEDILRWNVNGILPLETKAAYVTVRLPPTVDSHTVKPSWLLELQRIPADASFAPEELVSSPDGPFQDVSLQTAPSTDGDKRLRVDYALIRQLRRGEAFSIDLRWNRGGTAREAPSPTAIPLVF